MYYPDLSPFEYNSAYSGLNVGWLDGDHDFPTGDPPDGFVDALFSVIGSHEFTQCASPGTHRCGICLSDEVVFERNGDEIYVGNAEIAVPFDGVDYIAPTLIYHYVLSHGYIPPAPFIQGVLQSRIA